MPQRENGRRIARIFALTAIFALAAQAQNAPTVDDMKRAVESKLLKIWKAIGTAGERTVLFQSVQAGRATPGHYPFKATIVIHDQETGYPANKYYGRTCVGRLEDEVFVLNQDDFGGWNAEGRMTPDMSAQTCKMNTAAGVSAIPLASLTGSKAPAAGATGAGAATPARPAAAAPGTVPLGAYECWANGEARMLLNFTVLAGNQYRDSEGHTGAFRVDAANGRMTFQGANLDGFPGAGYYAVFYAPQGRATVSFRNSGGSEVTFCQH